MALGQNTWSDFGGAASDLFASIGAGYKSRGDALEGQNYDIAAQFADQEATYTEWSTAIKTAQQQRETSLKLGGQQADVAGAGFGNAGSAIDLMRDSAAQGALSKAVLNEQGLITEEGYREQAASYRNMADAARMASQAQDTAGLGALITGGVKGLAGLATLL